MLFKREKLHSVILVIGYDIQVRLCVETLLRQTKNNPLLIGEKVKIPFSCQVYINQRSILLIGCW